MIRPSHRLPVALLAAAAALWGSGCGSCESGERAAEKPTATAPAVEKAVEEPAAPPTEPMAVVEDPESDCFVIVDAEPDYGPPPLRVTFTTEVDCTAEPITYAWDFGDGTTGGNDPSPTHEYGKPGDYIAVVTVTSPDGGQGEDEIDITVDELYEE